MKHISFLNIRLAHEVIGCSKRVLPYLLQEQEICHTLIISPPRCGKTTLLRDLIRQLSNGCGHLEGMTVGVVDERSELGACYMGVPQNDLGCRTDILDGCPKVEGMMMMVRSMAPQAMAVDEVGSGEDVAAMEYVMNCGIYLLATAHGNSMDDIKNKPVLGRLVKERAFKRYILLQPGEVGQIGAIFDERVRYYWTGSGSTGYPKEMYVKGMWHSSGSGRLQRSGGICRVTVCDQNQNFGGAGAGIAVSIWGD